MKKIFTLIAASFLATSLFAETGINNPNNSKVKVAAKKFNNAFVKQTVANDIIVMPNADNGASVKFTTKKSGLAFVKVYDANGNLSIAEVAMKQAGKTTVSVKNITGLADGNYTVSVQVNNKNLSTSFMVWK